MLLNEIVLVLKKNELTFDEHILRKQGNRITLCILTLLHRTTFNFKGYQPGHCYISSEKTAILHDLWYIDENGKEGLIEEDFGTLQVNGDVVVQYNGKDLTVSHPVFTTELNVEEWCDQSLFSIEATQAGETQVLYRKVNFEAELGISENFKLIQHAPN